jgi:hypothetical protein
MSRMMARCHKHRCLARDSFRNNVNYLVLRNSPPKGGYRAAGRSLLADDLTRVGTAAAGQELVNQTCTTIGGCRQMPTQDSVASVILNKIDLGLVAPTGAWNVRYCEAFRTPA